MEDEKQMMLRQLPAVDAILKYMEDLQEGSSIPRPLLLQGARKVVSLWREKILLQDEMTLDFNAATLAEAGLVLAEKLYVKKLRKVINATGTILHTNLGRSLLSSEALRAVTEVGGNYSNLEMDLAEGERGERYAHVEGLICHLTGAESALVVNNNAAAVLLALSTLAQGKEVPVSRGELVEIGGSFRIPAVMSLSGAKLVEIGTTNKTHLSDYREAINAETALLMKVHTSNYRVVGFTSAVDLKELVVLGDEYNLPVLEDLGSGVLCDLSSYGLVDEPSVQARLAAGAAVVTFSGDKLLGGPQAGIIAGRKKYISLMKRNQLTRVLRIDKMTLAALEATLRLYLDEKTVLQKIPVLRMLTMSFKELEARAHLLARSLSKVIGDRGEVRVKEGFSTVGAGALPLLRLPTCLVAVNVPDISVSRLATELRRGEPPLILRLQQDQLLLDLRTLHVDELELIPTLFSKVLSSEMLSKVNF